MLSRRALFLALAACGPTARAAIAPLGVPLRFPEDYGAHPDARIEWWYVTGALESTQGRSRVDSTPTGGLTRSGRSGGAVESAAASFGFQITFFRAATGIEGAPGSRFAATELVFAHAAVTDLAARRLRHDQRIARSGFGIATARRGETELALRDWQLARRAEGDRSRYRAIAASSSAGFAFDLDLEATQPVLPQGVAGFSRKGPVAGQASRYYSEPQLGVRGTVALDGKRLAVTGRAWLDHEWSDTLLDPAAVGWDWIGMNLDDGAALTAFRLRRSDGSAHWAGGSYRPAGGEVRDFAAEEVGFVPGRTWTSAATRARYPVEWALATPVGRYGVRALLDDQELDSRASTGNVYWEGLSQLADASGRPVGRGYLEMTGYAGRLAL